MLKSYLRKESPVRVLGQSQNESRDVRFSEDLQHFVVLSFRARLCTAAVTSARKGTRAGIPHH